MHLAHDTISPTTGMSEITEDIWSQSHTHETTSHAQATCVKMYCSYIVSEHDKHINRLSKPYKRPIEMAQAFH